MYPTHTHPTSHAHPNILQDPALERFLAAADSEEPEAVAAAALLGELEGLAAEVDEYNEELLPADEDLQEYEALIDAALEYYDASPPEEAGAEPVGEEPVNMYADMDAALLGGETTHSGTIQRYNPSCSSSTAVHGVTAMCNAVQ